MTVILYIKIDILKYIKYIFMHIKYIKIYLEDDMRNTHIQIDWIGRIEIERQGQTVVLAWHLKGFLDVIFALLRSKS